MKGHAQVIEHLNALLVGELTAIDQYFLHSRMYQDMGLDKLFTQITHEMAEEQGHADLL
ncbi:MAG: ferritin-like domain-containing protein, partial [Candidatus Methylumidiphilus sp.]